MIDGKYFWQTILPKGYEVDPRREVLEVDNILIFSGEVFVDYPLVFFGKKMTPPPEGRRMPMLIGLDKSTGDVVWKASPGITPYWPESRLSSCVDRETKKLRLLCWPGYSVLDLKTGKYDRVDFMEKKEEVELLRQAYSYPFKDLFFIYCPRQRWAIYCPKKRQVVESGEGDWSQLNGPPIVCGNQIVFNARKELANYEYMDVTYVFVHEV